MSSQDDDAMYRSLARSALVVSAQRARAFCLSSLTSFARLANLLVLGAVAVLGGVPRTAFADAATVPVASVSVQHLDATVTKTTIITAFATARDVVEVYNYVPVQSSSDWRLATSMDNATWVFKPGGGPPKLGIFFTIEAGQHVARLYDDQLAEGAAPVTVKNNRVILSHPMHWTLQAESSQPWLLPDGRPATDVRIEGAFSLPHEDDALSFLAHRWHGQDAWDFRMVDPTGSGVPQYTILQLHPQQAQTANVPHTLIDVNVTDYHVTAFTNAIFWPYLGTADVGVRAWFDHRPPLSMDWKTGQFRDFGSIIPDLEPENGMQIFSATAVIANQTNDLDFENPFAYYRFDPGHTGYPNLIIRNYFYPPGDEFLQIGGTPQPAEFIRYSWGNGNGLLDYKLGLLGRFPSTTALTLSGFSVRTMDYARLPAWVISHRWDFETFVASEGGGYRSSEGIYDWDYVSGDFSWVFGEASSLPLEGYRSITPGLRGEYRVLPDTSPQLYLDPIDGRLHLLGAQEGVWVIDPHQTIDTASLNGETVDQWTRNIDNVPREAFYALPQSYLYSGDGTVVIQPHTPVPPVAPIAPPTDEASLVALRRLQPASSPSLATNGLRAMLSPEEHAQVTLTGVTLAHVRLLPNGWRAELQTGPAAAVLAAADAPPALLQPLETALGCLGSPGTGRMLPCPPGQEDRRYVLTYDGAWHVQAAPPPELKVLSVQAGTSEPSLAEMPVTVTVANVGAIDSTDQQLHIWAQRGGGERVDIATLDLYVPAAETREFTLSWLPPGAGHWSIGAALVSAGNVPVPGVATGPQPVTAFVTLPAEHWPAWWTLGPVPSRQLIGAAFAVLVALGVFTAVTAWSILR